MPLPFPYITESRNRLREKEDWKGDIQISFFILKYFSEVINILKYFHEDINIKWLILWRYMN